ncbi:hypothetical protein DAEQUDRAFT_723544 [Daedalea quercina L-15889]|uniref:DUF7918 domain-containing protein n=1 Tax=Daedalea quercina L-15889 TaxID=1314783 RepID=A0A165SFY6_9APHY|nr:hypothetical protein DAEQUDRAFT_723544 [Daedalea quercina L-15889]
MRQGMFQVFIKSEGRELPEYHSEAVDNKTLACYVATEVDKTFEICWRGDTRRDSHGTAVRCFVDGHYAGGAYCSRGILSGKRWGIREAEDRRRPFVFSALVTTDDDAVAVGSQTDPNLGMIEVKLEYAVMEGKTAFSTNADQFLPGKVHERSKKMGVQCVSLGDGQNCTAMDQIRSRSLNPKDPVYARFVFRYRSKDFLQAQGIIPVEERPANDAREEARAERKRDAAQSRPDVADAGPSRKRARNTAATTSSDPRDAVPVSTVENDEVVKMLEEELRMIQERAQVIQGRIQARKGSDPSPRIKHEQQHVRLEAASSTRHKLKRESSAIRLSTTGDVIDLTLD